MAGPSEKRRRLLPGPDGFARLHWSPGPGPEDLKDLWDDIPRSGTDKQKVDSQREAAKRLLKIGGSSVDIA